ncbi:MAG: tRNA epoxyqueuosine(34) reductase QueG [Candidatus Latescibacterota bacterium]
MTLTQQIRRRAGELGFDPVGFAPADPLEGAAFHARWVALGYGGEMAYLARNQDRRGDPRLLLPGARSAICLGLHYYQETPAEEAPGQGRLSCYARGDDYHDLIRGRLRLLEAFIRQAAGRPVRARSDVDTGPVLERELARRAGLGWWGKNTCLINRGSGSFFFLAEILLDLELDWDEPATDHCGTCTRCLAACPTQAFPEPYVLDARRCISYLTIELKGAIPAQLRPRMGRWVFGCDVCQDVCPWNRKVRPSADTGLQGRPGLARPDLEELLRLDAEGFTARFRRSPVKRAKRRGLLRNVAVALGNTGDRRAVPALAEALQDVETLVRGHAAWALGRLGGRAALEALQAALASEPDPQVVEEIRLALGGAERPEVSQAAATGSS